MSDQPLQQKIFPYDGTFDATKNPILISPKDVVDSNNIVYTTYSTKKLRPGISPALSPAPAIGRPILRQIDFWRLSQQRIVSWDGKRIYAFDPLTGVRQDITGTNDLPEDEAVTFVVFAGLLIIFFTGGETPVKYWTMSGELKNLSDNCPRAPFGVIWLNSLWVPDPTVPGRVFKSQTGDPTDFVGNTDSPDVATEDLDVGDGDSEGITAMFPPFFGSLYITKRFATFKLTPVTLADGTVAFQQAKIDDGVGCISHNCVVAANGNIFFPSDWGWHTFQSTTQLSEIAIDLLSRDIQPLWVEDTNFLQAKYFQATYDRSLDSILCVYSSGSNEFPDSLWGFSFVAKKWYRWLGYGQTSICRYVDSSKKKVETLVGSADGKIGTIDKKTNTDHGQSFGCSLQSGLICPGGTPDEAWIFNAIAPLFVPQISGKFTVTYKIDGLTIEAKEFSMQAKSLGADLGAGFLTGVTPLGGVPQIKLDKREMKGEGMVYQMLVDYVPERTIDSSVGFELLGILVDVSTATKSDGERVA